VALAALALAYAAGSAAVFPHYLEFFNAAAGGPQSGYTQLVDSSLDWGQDDDLPVRFARERGIAALQINESPFEAREGWLALSANAYQGVYHREPGLDGRGAWSWATKLAPRARLAHTWFVYEIGEPDLRAYALAHPDDALAWLDLGQVLLARRDLAGARASFERAEEIGGDRRSEPALRLAQLELAAGDTRAALPAIERALRHTPRSREIQRWRAIARADARLAELPGDADDQSEWAAAMADKLRATCELRDRDACRRVFETLRASPVLASAAWWHGVGLGHLALGELDPARAAFERAVALAPESDAYRETAAVAVRLAESERSPLAQDHTELASALAKMGLFRLAMDQYLAAHALDPGAPAPLWAMGELQIARRLGRSPFAWP
jgi:tetratricopeptide (TPR) repeat protein